MEWLGIIISVIILAGLGAVVLACFCKVILILNGPPKDL